MKEEVLRLLRKNNSPRNWSDVLATVEKNGNLTKKVGQIENEPIYRFFDTYSDDLTLNSSSISIAVQPTNSFIPYHIHDYVEIMIPLIEDCVVVLEHSEIKVKQNNLIFMGNRTIHKVKPISKKGVVVNIALRSSAFSLNELDYLNHRENGSNISNILFSLLSNEEYGEGRYSLFEVNHDVKITNLIYDIISEYYHPDIQSDQLIRLEMLTLFSLLIRQAANAEIKVKDFRKKNNNLLSLLLYIEKHYSNITLQKMATHFGFNQNYLSDYLKKHTGKTFIQLVHLQRINVAAEYLTYTTAPIERIATRVGYENPSYFYKIFKKYFGISPAEYRQKNS
ncbi:MULTISPECIES: AraC family transcriptional regulator [unclassified Lactobacillus]|uniref:AraC family transcriptional regulator n=1 Tax=unclassified Lactobacillus TaxID=2620435 RepID=UPI000EFA44DD|nr:MULTISPECIES: AraC family transcriptional regulator [unclassified Lactobacillus]RMC25047.1 AraC family transcriptional regulator [Lactobacillus sp. ESL0247]RMC29202.1 AraC family transcriptional regulator [Lactobacillus sp. ESL0246]RMC32805.1 AraC family transcriptional regulator [Lactobacillus sp. ESL0245]